MKVLSGFDADSTHERTRAINRLRGLLLQIFPAPERVIPGTVLTRTVVLDMLINYAVPAGLRAADSSNVLRGARNHSREDPVLLVDAVFQALGEQSVSVTGTNTVELVIRRVAAQIKELRRQCSVVAEEVEKLLDDFPLSGVLLPCRESASRPPPRDLIRDEFPSRSANKQLKNALAGPAGPPPATTRLQAYYERKRAEDKKHSAAIICLAPRRCATGGLTKSIRTPPGHSTPSTGPKRRV